MRSWIAYQKIKRLRRIPPRTNGIPNEGVPSVGHEIDADTRSFILSGSDANLLAARQMAAAVGTFTETGNAAGLLAARRIAAAQGTFTFTGNAATLTYGAGTYDPAVLALAGWWRANSTTGYATGTFDGVASAGSSGSRDLTEATNPPSTGTTLNGHTVADFDGANDLLGTALTLDDFVNANAIGGWVLFNTDLAPADPGAGSRYSAAQIWTDVIDAYFHVGHTSNGVHFSCDAGATYVQTACGTGGWHLAQFKYDGTNAKLRVDSGAWGSVASSGPGSLVRALRMGANANASAFYDGKIADAGLIDSALSDATFDDVKTYINSRYALSL